MAFLTGNNLKELIGKPSEECVSIYLPTHRTAPDSLENPIRFSNLLGQAEQKLLDSGLPAQDVKQLLQPGTELKDDTQFWTHQRDGLAVFIGNGLFRTFRLPKVFDEYVEANDQFHVTPLLSLLQSNGSYYVLAVSQNSCRLFSGDRDHFEELEVETLPDDLQSALNWWRENEVNFHSYQARPQGRGGDATTMVHGHADEKTGETDLSSYLRRIDRALNDALEDGKTPIVFAGVEETFPVYRDLTKLKQLVQTPVTGNPDDFSEQELHQKSWEVVEPLFRKNEDAVLEEFGNRAAQDTATSELPAVLVAARDGLVQTLLIAEGERQWGRFNEDSGSTVQNNERQKGDVDLIELATMKTLGNSGEVLAIEPARMPDDQPAAALLRAPVEAVASE